MPQRLAFEVDVCQHENAIEWHAPLATKEKGDTIDNNYYLVCMRT